MLEHLTKEEIGIAVLILLMALNLFYAFLKSVERKANRPKKKAIPKAPVTLESLEKRVLALENKNKPKAKRK